jgi:hypothetical protein
MAVDSVRIAQALRNVVRAYGRRLGRYALPDAVHLSGRRLHENSGQCRNNGSTFHHFEIFFLLANLALQLLGMLPIVFLPAGLDALGARSTELLRR